MFDQALEAIMDYLAETKHISKDSMTKDSLFVEELNGKSLDYAHLSSFLEAEFDVDIPYMKFSKQKTLGEMAQYVADAI